jgi:hypothetical protein
MGNLPTGGIKAGIQQLYWGLILARVGKSRPAGFPAYSFTDFIPPAVSKHTLHHQNSGDSCAWWDLHLRHWQENRDAPLKAQDQGS